MITVRTKPSQLVSPRWLTTTVVSAVWPPTTRCAVTVSSVPSWLIGYVPSVIAVCTSLPETALVTLPPFQLTSIELKSMSGS